jgi:Curli production assembly/transport component CsgG
MYTKWILLSTLCLLVVRIAIAQERPRVAVPQFRNTTGKTLRISGSEMAVWMAEELKRNKKFEPIEGNKLNAAIKDSKWYGTRFDRDTELRLKELPADFVLYGRVQAYRVENYILNDPWGGDEAQVPEIKLEFLIRMLNLNGHSRDQEFIARGDALADRTLGFGGPPYNENDSSLDVPFQQAARKAMRTAVKTLAEHLQ